MKSKAVQSDPEILGGEVCFAGTRVPAEYLFNYLSRGYTVEYFVDQFPTVRRELVLELLSDSAKQVLEIRPT
jgi:uncharacterized protein (DUF433 family)